MFFHIELLLGGLDAVLMVCALYPRIGGGQPVDRWPSPCQGRAFHLMTRGISRFAKQAKSRTADGIPQCVSLVQNEEKLPQNHHTTTNTGITILSPVNELSAFQKAVNPRENIVILCSIQTTTNKREGSGGEGGTATRLTPPRSPFPLEPV